MKSPYVRAARVLVRPLGLLSVMLGLLALLGYALDIEPLFRPLRGGPATNPLTALTVLALGSALALKNIRHRFAGFCLALASLTSGCRIFDAFFDTTIAKAVTPFRATIAAQLAAGESNAMGINTAAMLFLIALSLFAHRQRRPLASQALAFLALALPMISLTGYAYGIAHFYGQMALTTVSQGCILGIGTLCLSPHREVMRAILAPYIGGRIARAQVALGFAVPFLFGLLLLRVAALGAADNLFGLFVVATSWFILVLVAVSAVIQERIDWHRRVIERALNFAAANDPLTLLPNRRKFFEVGRREWSRLQRTPGTFSLLMIDIDHFKRINDTGGHATGDHVLMMIGQQLHQSVRATDFPARIGGEEFAVLLPDTALAGAFVVAEEVRQRIEELVFEAWPPQLGPVTVSIGCACSDGKHSLDEVLSTADIALYQAKGQGRNRTLIEPEPHYDLVSDGDHP